MMKNHFTSKFSLFTVLVAVLFTFQFCSPTKKASKSEDKVSFANDIMPIMSRSCTPCHFPPDGRVEKLDDYASVSSHIDEILERVQLPADAKGYMPFKGKKQALNEDEINLFKTWQAQGMAK